MDVEIKECIKFGRTYFRARECVIFLNVGGNGLLLLICMYVKSVGVGEVFRCGRARCQSKGMWKGLCQCHFPNVGGHSVKASKYGRVPNVGGNCAVSECGRELCPSKGVSECGRARCQSNPIKRRRRAGHSSNQLESLQQGGNLPARVFTLNSL